MPATYAALTARDRDWGLDEFVAEVNRLLPEVVPGDAAARAKLEVNARLVRHYATEGVLPKPLKEGVGARYDGDHLVRMLALRRLLAEGYPSAVAGRFLQQHDRERLARFLLGELRLDLDLGPGGPPVVESPRSSADTLARLAALRARAGLPPLPHDTEDGAKARVDTRSGPQASAPPSSAQPSSAPQSSAPSTSAPTVRSFALRHHHEATPSAMPADAVFSAADAPDAERAPTVADAGVDWTRYPLTAGLELHVRSDFVDPTTPAAWNALRDALLARLEAIALERTIRR